MARSIRPRSMFAIQRRQLTVIGTRDLTAGMRRVILGGPGLHAHDADGHTIDEFRSTGFDDDVKLFFPHPGTGRAEVPAQLDGRLDWTPEVIAQCRTYTVRDFDPDRGEVAVDFVRHSTGLAASWAESAAPGDRIDIAGPTSSAHIPEGIDWLLIAGDETALPALARCLEQLPAGLTVRALIEVAEPGHRQDLSTPADADITWLYRSEHPDTSPLADAALAENRPPGDGFAWVAGEATTLRPIRRHLRDAWALGKDRFEVIGYWRHRPGDQVDHTDHDADAASAPAALGDDTFTRLHDMAELAPPFALRAAVTLDLPGLIASGATSTESLAAKSGTDVRGLGKLLRYLSTLELIVAHDDGSWANTYLGDALADEGMLPDALDLRGAPSRMDLSFGSLLDAVAKGGPVTFERSDSFAQALDSDAALAASHHDYTATIAGYSSALLPDRLDISNAASVALVGETAGVLADEILSVQPQVTVHLVGLPSVLNRAVADVRSGLDRIVRHEQSVFERLPGPVDLVVLADVLDEHPDDDAVLLLRRLADRSPAIVAVTDVLDAGRVDEHAAEEDLRRLCLYGAGRRTGTELEALASAAGLSLSTAAFGFSGELATFRPIS